MALHYECVWQSQQHGEVVPAYLLGLGVISVADDEGHHYALRLKHFDPTCELAKLTYGFTCDAAADEFARFTTDSDRAGRKWVPVEVGVGKYVLDEVKHSE